ncbi:MAG: hypothetical protein ACRCVV_21915 [Shewanella sp.]
MTLDSVKLTMFSNTDNLDDLDADFEALGLIPKILSSAYVACCRVNPELTKPLEKKAFIDAISALYGFPLIEMGGEVGKVIKGVYSYKGDSDLYPLAKYTIGELDIYQYPYGIIAFMFDTPFITRMD